MLAKSIKNIAVFIFLFGVLEKTGIELITLVKLQWCLDNPTELFEPAENTKDSEKKGEKSLKEFWLATVLQTSTKPITIINSSHSLFTDTNIFHIFYPSVPTPPPDLMVVYML